MLRFVVLYVTIFVSVAYSWNLVPNPQTWLKRAAVAAIMGCASVPAHAVSGGGLDYANKVITGESFAGQKLLSKDFSQCDGATADFKGAVLTGSRFYRSNLKEADFTNADLTSVSLEDTRLDAATFKNAVMVNTYLSDSIKDVASLEGADLTDAQMPDFARKAVCKRADLDKANPKTGVTTAESLFCP